MTRVGPLTWNVPIVDSDGQPTTEFQTKWRQQQQANAGIPDLSTAAQVSAILDKIGGSPGDLLRRGALEWEPLTASGNSAQFLNGAGTYTTPNVTSLVGFPGGITDFLRADGSFAAPSGGGGGSSYIGVPRVDSHSNTSFSSGFFGGRSIIAPEGVGLTDVCIMAASASASTELTPVIYENSGGNLGDLISSGPTVSGVSAGINEAPLSSPLNIPVTVELWVGFICQVISFSAVSANPTNGAFFATGTSTPPNPAPGASYSNQGWSSMFLKAA